MLEVLSDMEDEGSDPNGGRLLDTKDEKGFKGFQRSPYAWPDELVRLVLAACFRAGAIYIEKQTPSGPTPYYDYRGTDELFSKISVFKKVTFQVAETSLTVDQIKRANKALIALGVNGIPESGNAIAAAVRDLGLALKTRLGDAKARSQQGLPIPDAVLAAEDALTEPTTAKDPTAAVNGFLAKEDEWKALLEGLNALRTFLETNRHKDYDASRQLIALADNHPVPEGHPKAGILAQARKDMKAIAEEKAVIARWSDYRSAFETAFEAYRDVYAQMYEKVCKSIEETLADIKKGNAYRGAPSPQRDQVMEKVFGVGKVCHYPGVTLPTVDALLEVAGKRGLSSLEQALVALSGYRAQVEAELHALALPPLPPDKKVFEWRPVAALAGKRFTTEEEVDQALESVACELKNQIRKGFTVVVM